VAEILLIADIHLSPANPQSDTFAALMARAARADALYILGDLFDYWVGDEQPLPDAIGHSLDQLSALPCKKYFQAGNRDFLIGQNLLDRIGAENLPDVFALRYLSETILLCHGDTLCTDDLAYQAMRQQLRSAAFRCDFLAKPLAERIAIAEGLRARSKTESSSKPEDIMDVNASAVSTLMQTQGAKVLIHGHTHRPAIHRLVDEGARVVTGDWSTHGWLVALNADVITLERFDSRNTEIIDRITLSETSKTARETTR
jgi:UDP-2,3-diacylglucosamine hydrolase